MKQNLSIIARLKKIALTTIDLGREMAKDKASRASQSFSQSLKDSRAGQFYDSTRQRLDQALGRAEAGLKKYRRPKAKGLETAQRPPASGKRHLGAEKYSAKAARLTPH
jgi:hypothetical protein